MKEEDLESLLIQDEKEVFDYEKHIIDKSYINNRLNDYINGNIPQGYKTGFHAIDDVIVCKINEMFACVGKKGRGKTTIEEILLLMWAMSNNLTFALALQENDVSLEKMNLLGYIFGENPSVILKQDKELYKKGVEWLDEHFIFLEIDSFKEATEVVKALIKSGRKIDGLFCDPVNSIESGFKDTGNTYADEKHTAKEMLNFSKRVCTTFLSQHPTMAGQRSTEDINSYSAEGGHFLNKAHFTWAINRDNGSNVNRISVDNIRNKYTGGNVTHPEAPLLLVWHPNKIDIINQSEKEEDIIQKIRKRYNPLKEVFTENLPNVIENKELPRTTPEDAFGDATGDNPIPF